MNNVLRVGRISSINYAAGTARVLYNDRDKEVTREFPMLANGEYYPLMVDDMVYVLHLPTGSSAGLILGRAWSNVNVPPEGAQGVWRADLSRTNGRCYVRFDDTAGVLTVHVDGERKINIEAAAGDVSVSAKNVTVTAATGDVQIGGISLINHTHGGDSGGSTTAPR